ncbi:MAG: YdeI/OmpD-associated family protein [Bacteroidota bacterium]
MTPLFFAHPADLREWFEKNFDKATEVLIGFYKVGTGKPSITWSQSVDAALCFGWIDGVRRSLGEESYCIRFTPRKPKSIWSAVNIQKVAELTAQGLMKPAGLAAFEKREDKYSKIYAFEQKEISLSEDFRQTFEANSQAWDFFQSQAPSYQKTAIWWVISAKQEATQKKRLATLIEDSAAGRKLKHLQRGNPLKSEKSTK